METSSQIGSLSSAVTNSEPGTSLTVKREVDDPAALFKDKGGNSKVIETDSNYIEFEFLQTKESTAAELETRCKSEPPDSDTEEVLEKIFDAAASGNSKEISKLIFTDYCEDSDERLDLRRKQTVTEVPPKPIYCGSYVVKGLKRKIENGDLNGVPSKAQAQNSQRLVNFTNIKNLTGVPIADTGSIQSAPSPDATVPQKKNLIDYSVLTRALTQTLESKLSGKENDVKIVIFCNNKPIQSFSVRGNTNGERSLTENENENYSTPIPNRLQINEKLRCKLKSATNVDKAENEEGIAAVASDNQKVNVDDNDSDNTNGLVIDESADVDVKQDSPQDDTNVINESLNAETENIKCDLCGRGFRLRRYLNRHMVRVHRKLRSPVIEDNTGSALSAETHEPNNNDISVDDNSIHTPEELDATAAEEPVSESEEELGYRYIQSLFQKEKLKEIFDSSSDNSPEVFPGIRARELEKLEAGAGKIEPVFVCEHCGKFYRARKTLREHFQREHQTDEDAEPLYIYIAGDKYQCSICFNNFHSAGDLLAHSKTHTGELRSSCKICGKVYSSVHVLRRHIDNIHSEVRPRPFQCELCDYAASNKWHLKEHYRRHTGEQPYTCPICQKSFSHQGTMNRHCKTIHKFDAAASKLYAKNALSSISTSESLTADQDISSEELETIRDIVSPAHTEGTGGVSSKEVSAGLIPVNHQPRAVIVKNEPEDMEIEVE